MVEIGGPASRRIGELMRPAPSISPRVTVTEAARLMRERGTGWLTVASGSYLMGVVTERDILHRAVEACLFTDATSVAEVMSSRLIVGTPRMEIRAALDVLGRHDFRALPVVEDEKVVGVVSVPDLLPGQPQERLDIRSGVSTRSFMPRPSLSSLTA